MRISLITSYPNDLNGKLGSMGKFVELLSDQLGNCQGIKVEKITPPVIFGRFKPGSIAASKWLGYIDKFVINQIRLKFLSKRELVHICDQAYGLYVPWIERMPHLITCHDVIAIQAATGLFRNQKIGVTGRIYQKLNLRGLRRAKLIVCDSEHTRNSLIEIGGIPRERTRVVYIGLNYPYRKLPPSEVNERLRRVIMDRGARFILHLGGNEFYKNRMGVLRIFKRILERKGNQNLILIMAGPLLSAEMTSFIKHSNFEKFVIQVSNPDNNLLEALYNKADIFLFPSISEGFGWPVIESQACGTPVVSSNNGSLSEITGNSVMSADAGDEEQLASHVIRLFEDRTLYEELVIMGNLNVRRFSLHSMMSGYYDAYRDAMNESRNL